MSEDSGHGTGLAALMDQIISGVLGVGSDAAEAQAAAEAGNYERAKEFADRAIRGGTRVAGIVGTHGVDLGFVETASDCDTPVAAMDGGCNG